MFMICVQDQDAVNSAGQHRVNLVILCRHAEHQLEQVFRVGEVVTGLNEWLTQRVFKGVGADGRHLRDQPVGGGHALQWIVDVGAVVVERRQRANHPNHDGHRVGAAHEPALEPYQLFVQHGVAGNVAVELLLFFRGG